jgi:hypothetical protein
VKRLKIKKKIKIRYRAGTFFGPGTKWEILLMSWVRSGNFRTKNSSWYEVGFPPEA